MSSPAIWAPQRARILFLHLPKTAGMTLRSFLGNQYSVSQTMPATSWADLLYLDISDISKYQLFQGHFSCGILDLLPHDVRPIVFLREPVARTVSHLKHLRRDPNFHPAHRLAAGRSLDELVRDDRIMNLCTNVQVALLSNDIPAATILAGMRRDREAGRVPDQDTYAVEPNPAKAERMLSRFHYVGFVENLQEDVLQMSLALGLHPPRQVAKNNDDPEGETNISELDPDTLALLRERNALDIEFYEAARRRPRLAWDAVGAAMLEPAVYRPISQPVDFELSGAIPGSNWFPCEEDGSGLYRWAGPLNDTTLDLPFAPGYRFEVSLTMLIENLDDLNVDVNGIGLPLQPDWSEGRRHRVSFWIPAEAVEQIGLTPLRFRTKRIFRGSDTDLRMLSFMVRELQISRVERASRRRRRLKPKPMSVQADEIGIADGQADGVTPTEPSSPVKPMAKDLHLGKVAVLDEPTGFFGDGWVRARAMFRCQALETITSMSLELWAPPGDEPLTVTLKGAGGNEMTVPVPRGDLSVVRYLFHSAPATEFQIELVANREQKLSDTDERHAAYVLKSISFS